MPDSVWIAFNDKDVWPMQHEGDYADGDNLIQINADGQEGMYIRFVKNESPQTGEDTWHGLSFSQYQARAFTTAHYPRHRNPLKDRQGDPIALAYCIGKLNGEAGEASEAFWKHQRSNATDAVPLVGPSAEARRQVLDECGDVLWYIAALCTELGLDLETLAAWNLEKLSERARHGKEGWSESRKQQILDEQ